jgi:hypothetical protein
VRLILEALISFFPDPGKGAIGSLDYSSTERKKLAKEVIIVRAGKHSTIVLLVLSS